MASALAASRACQLPRTAASSVYSGANWAAAAAGWGAAGGAATLQYAMGGAAGSAGSHQTVTTPLSVPCCSRTVASLAPAKCNALHGPPRHPS